MAIEDVRHYLVAYGKAHDIIEFPVSSATVSLAADALGVDGASIAKTLSFVSEDGCILVVTSGDARIDNKKFKQRFKMKPRMLGPEAVVALTGHPVGGVCPFAVGACCHVFADIALQRFDHVYPACGSANSAIEMTPAELFVIARCADWVDVCSAWQK